MKEKIIEQAKLSFQANLLDGDKVGDCGKAMLSAEFVWEFLEETLLPEFGKEYADWKIKECLPERAENIITADDQISMYQRGTVDGWNDCIDQILSNKDKK